MEDRRMKIVESKDLPDEYVQTIENIYLGLIDAEENMGIPPGIAIAIHQSCINHYVHMAEKHLRQEIIDAVCRSLKETVEMNLNEDTNHE